MESLHSPYGFHSPMQFELGNLLKTQPFESHKNSQGKPTENSKVIVAVDKFTQYSLLPSLGDLQKKQENTKFPLPMTMINRERREDLSPSVMKVGPIAGEEGQRFDRWRGRPEI
jgi:hypothetical protein